MIKQKITLLILISISLISCKESYPPFSGKLSADSLQFADIDPEKRQLILQLDEPTSVVTNSELRSFKTNELIQVRPSSRNMIQVTSYSAQAILNIKIYCKIKNVEGLNDNFHILTIDSLPGFGQFEYQPTFTKDEATYQTANGKYLSFYQPYFAENDFEFSVDSDDEYFQKLKTIKSEWSISFSNYHWNGVSESGSWREMSAIYAREWVVIMTNYAYMVSSPEFEEIMSNYKTVYGGDLYGNGGTSDVFDLERYKELGKNLTGKRTFLLGRTGMGGGLGGGTTLGADHWIFYSHYISREGWHTVVHEMSHCMGYSHASNMTYGNHFGFADGAIPKLHSYMRRKKMLPYCDRDILGFINPENRKYLKLGIAPDFIVEDNNTNVVDEYFEK